MLCRNKPYAKENKMKKIICLATALLMSACTSNINSDHYTTSSVGMATAARICTVVSVRQVTVQSENGVGTLFGAGLGGVAGSAIGGGDTAHILGAIGGALAGGIAGGAAQDALSKQGGYEYVVKLENGQLMTLTQGQDVLLSPGQRCMLLSGNPARLTAY